MGAGEPELSSKAQLFCNTSAGCASVLSSALSTPASFLAWTWTSIGSPGGRCMSATPCCTSSRMSPRSRATWAASVPGWSSMTTCWSMFSKLEELRPARRASRAVAPLPWELASVGAVASGLEHDVSVTASPNAAARIKMSGGVDALRARGRGESVAGCFDMAPPVQIGMLHQMLIRYGRNLEA
jgi:hypothetical protein